MSEARTRAFAVVTGGGTAGHVLPALAVAEALVERGHDQSSIHYVGAQRGIETRLVPPTGYPYTFLDVIGLQRRIDRSNLSFPQKLARAEGEARRLLRATRPQVVVSVGGYASLPAVLAARRLRIPIVAISYDRRPGRASQLTARLAAATAVAYEGSRLPRARLTGAPLRRAILDVDRDRDRAAAREALGLPGDRFVLLVVGGSLGSEALNGAVHQFVEEAAGRRDLAVRHVVGERHRERYIGTARTSSEGILYDVIGFEDRMPAAYAAADLVLARAGATTLAELSAIGVPSMLVPWPDAAEDHQTANALLMVERGAAVLVREPDLSAARLAEELDHWEADPEGLAAMATAARRVGEIHRSGRLADLIEEVAAR